MKHSSLILFNLLLPSNLSSFLLQIYIFCIYVLSNLRKSKRKILRLGRFPENLLKKKKKKRAEA